MVFTKGKDSNLRKILHYSKTSKTSSKEQNVNLQKEYQLKEKGQCTARITKQYEQTKRRKSCIDFYTEDEYDSGTEGSDQSEYELESKSVTEARKGILEDSEVESHDSHSEANSDD